MAYFVPRSMAEYRKQHYEGFKQSIVIIAAMFFVVCAVLLFFGVPVNKYINYIVVFFVFMICVSLYTSFKLLRKVKSDSLDKILDTSNQELRNTVAQIQMQRDVCFVDLQYLLLAVQEDIYNIKSSAKEGDAELFLQLQNDEKTLEQLLRPEK